MKLACFRAKRLLQRRASGISGAAGLFLEEHLVACDDCRSTANLLSGLHELSAGDAATLTPERREQVIVAALAAVPSNLPPSAALMNRWKRGWLLVPALAAIALLVSSRASHNSSARTSEAGSGDRVLSGQLLIAGVSRGAGRALQPHTTLDATTDATLALAHATVQLRANSKALWNADEHALQLSSGSVSVDVNPALHRPFVVQTERFRVLVLGTHFEVSLDTVQVQRGRVRVVSALGEELAMLDAEHQNSWRYSPPRVQEAAVPAPSDAEPAKTVTPRVEAELRRARAMLTAQQIAGARAVLTRILRMSISDDQRAEALSLYADCALFKHEYAAASAAYLRVANELPDLPASQTALFAAARVESEHGQPAAARQLFARYLRHYPSGRFAKEATARLQTREGAPK
jgi:TolA-binding protein